MGGYGAKSQSVRAWSTKAIPKGQELVNGYGEQFDSFLVNMVIFYQMGTGSSIVWLSSYHDISLMGGLTGSLGVSPSLSLLYSLIPYFHMDYGGYPECIHRDFQPDVFELNRLKLFVPSERVAIDHDWWILQLPTRSSIDSTPFSTKTLQRTIKFNFRS